MIIKKETKLKHRSYSTNSKIQIITIFAEL